MTNNRNFGKMRIFAWILTLAMLLQVLPVGAL